MRTNTPAARRRRAITMAVFGTLALGAPIAEATASSASTEVVPAVASVNAPAEFCGFSFKDQTLNSCSHFAHKYMITWIGSMKGDPGGGKLVCVTPGKHGTMSLIGPFRIMTSAKGKPHLRC